jgi:hypothetical protein
VVSRKSTRGWKTEVRGMTYKQKLYCSNPEYRERCIARVKLRHEQRRTNPAYARLVAVRKKICDRRDSIERFLNRITGLEKDLMKLIAERDRLAARLKAR